MIIHYNCTIGSIVLHSFLLIYHPYPPSFHEMIFILVYRMAKAMKQLHSILGYLRRMERDQHVLNNVVWFNQAHKFFMHLQGETCFEVMQKYNMMTSLFQITHEEFNS